MKLSCTMIVRDEASTLRACLESIRPHVDELVIVDTGSTDDTPGIAREFADVFEVWTGCNDSEGRIADFSAARNHALELATGDAVCWFDGDDVVRGGEHLRDLVKAAPAAGAWSWVLPYEYDRDAAGRVTVLQWRERVVYPRVGWEWRGPVHEGLLAKAGYVPVTQQADMVVVEHRTHQSAKPRERARNLRILETYIRRVGESDPRMLHYFGAELLTNGRIGEACHWFRRHAQLSPWSDERCLSLMHLGRVAYAMGDHQQAIDWALQASVTKSWPEPYWLMGTAMLALSESGQDSEHNLRRGVFFLEQGFKLDTAQADSLLMKDPTARFDAYSWLAPALAKLGRGNEAIAAAEAGLRGKPENTELKANLVQLKKARVAEQVAELEQMGELQQGAQAIVKATLTGEFKVERRAIADGFTIERRQVSQLERDIVADPEARLATIGAGLRMVQRLQGEKLRIAFYIGHQLEPWTPETLERDGMGGSETMAWEMSKRLAKLGHSVSVFGHCDDDYEVEPNLYWFDASRFTQTQGEFDILIVSRQAGAATLPHKAKARVLWVHDVHVGEQFHPAEAALYDTIWCLSQWHKAFFLQCYPWLPAGKVEVTRNGIDPERFGRTGQVHRNPHRAVYSSSPDRGLLAAVQAWPAVRKLIPDAELHVFYGFDNWERALELCINVDHPHCGRDALNELKLAIAKTPGIVLRGRVGPRELERAMLESGVWAYSTWFTETSCITAMQAQAANLWCVCPPLAALTETVPDDRRIWTGDFVADVVWAMQQPAPSYGVSHFDLDELALEWGHRLRKLAEQVVPTFVEAAQ